MTRETAIMNGRSVTPITLVPERCTEKRKGYVFGCACTLPNQRPTSYALLSDEERTVPKGTKLSRFILAEAPSIPTLVGSWVSSVGELSRTTLRGPLIKRDFDFRLHHSSTLFTFFVVFPKRCRYWQTRALVPSCARTPPASLSTLRWTCWRTLPTTGSSWQTAPSRQEMGAV